MSGCAKPLIGVLGGMGPEASSLFYQMVTECTKASADQDNINILLYSHASIPDRTACIEGGRQQLLQEALLESCLLLQKAGVQCIAIICNTCHVYIDYLRKNLQVEIISIVEHTVEAVKEVLMQGAVEKGAGNKVAVLGTDGTIASGMYQQALEAQGMCAYELSSCSQSKLMHLIYHNVKAGRPIDQTYWQEIDAEIKEQGCALAILACTELSVVAKKCALDDYYVDATLVLAKKAIECGGGEV